MPFCCIVGFSSMSPTPRPKGGLTPSLPPSFPSPYPESLPSPRLGLCRRLDLPNAQSPVSPTSQSPGKAPLPPSPAPPGESVSVTLDPPLSYLLPCPLHSHHPDRVILTPSIHAISLPRPPDGREERCTWEPFIRSGEGLSAANSTSWLLQHAEVHDDWGGPRRSV